MGFDYKKNSTSKEDGGLHGGYGLRLAPLQTYSKEITSTERVPSLKTKINSIVICYDGKYTSFCDNFCQI